MIKLKRYKIADVIVDIKISEKILDKIDNGNEEKIIHEYFKDFEYYESNEKSKESSTDILWNVVFLDLDFFTMIKGKNIYCTPCLSIDKTNDNEYVYTYERQDNVPKIIECKKNFKECIFYIPTVYEKENLGGDLNVSLIKICLYNMFREMFFYYATVNGYIPIHSASIIYNEKAYLFSASSGVGKSTHTNLWHDIYGVDILNGDVCLCKPFLKEKRAYAYSLPWCGTSGIYSNKKALLDGVVFLARGRENKVLCIERKETGLGLFINNFSIFLDERIVDHVVSTINDLVKCIKGYKLWCLPNKEAVELIKNKISEKKS